MEEARRDAAVRWLEQRAAAAPGDPSLEQLRALIDQSTPVAPSDGS